MRRILFFFGIVALVAGCSQTVSSPPLAQAEEGSAKSSVSSGECPQSRKTPKAPGHLLKKKNPQTSPAAVRDGKELYHKTSKPFTCETCHGVKGDGLGDPDFESNPPARNFTCKATMEPLSDGQLFWVIKRGSPTTSMPGFGGNLSDDDIWKLVAYLRTFAK
ncbi:MAG: cytochrome c [Candidatus Nitronauta litoralis]|uniref:Type IV secretion system putative lipoprotein virB7 n=1 Tax=Candidatus Nitronauta litoralis TaxID=2705533 RepID=A0A7T0BUB4_9BACT|nr:MAG: cytochrome c [Candidatus Nitronauta litoralis]